MMAGEKCKLKGPKPSCIFKTVYQKFWWNWCKGTLFQIFIWFSFHKK